MRKAMDKSSGLNDFKGFPSIYLDIMSFLFLLKCIFLWKRKHVKILKIIEGTKFKNSFWSDFTGQNLKLEASYCFSFFGEFGP